jgi:putative hydrolase of the HAD superfamily
MRKAERQYRWIAFDAVGTLIYPFPAAGVVYHQVAGRFGSRLAADEVTRRFRLAFRESEREDAELSNGARLVTSEVREYERWRGIVTGVLDDVQDVAGCFAELFAHFALPASWRCFDEVPDLLAALQARGYHVAIASNFDRRLHSVCDGFPSLRDLKTRIISSEVGYRKPGRCFFEALVRQVGCQPDELLMVGDDPANDIDGARHAGLSALLINRRSPPGPGEIGNLRELISMLEP